MRSWQPWERMWPRTGSLPMLRGFRQGVERLQCIATVERPTFCAKRCGESATDNRIGPGRSDFKQTRGCPASKD